MLCAGMVALSVKRERTADENEMSSTAVDGESKRAAAEFASGTAPVGSGEGWILSCSDKICR